ncbi:MAG: GTPase HflX [Ignavibacteria bacterium]|jgi:GTP-binding protein HflX|nr:GTPase HflX [Ignavibacteria bacterium]MCU7498867.1 GTPase HflX [Ignavibacteria bacterium]MCU7514336.1 GTPase HflX [Ignavibacteria bacterium]MCU7520768.1 GTPase HflX [Ignavibacteria bacterium]
MIENQKNTTEKAILVSLNTREYSKQEVEEHLDELEMLASTAGADTRMKVIQDRDRIEPAYYLGKGKAEELAQLVEFNDIDIVIFDDDLTPVQVRNLERLVNKKIVDRSGLILDIFATRAKTREAKTQVELAQLQYMLPRLTRAWTHLSKQYGGIGTKGPGETQIETDRRMIRTRISMLKEKLEKIESQRQTRSANRKDFFRASLVGYTNAGKSTLLNLLTNAGVLAEDKLFATLDSTTRSLRLDNGQTILLSDTVGFIRKLPHHLVASFKSTLNEVSEADVILHVIDVSHPFFEDHIAVVDQTLKELGVEKKAQIKIFNKVDALEDKTRIDYILRKYMNAVFISAERGININGLKDKIKSVIEEEFKEETVELELTDSRTVAKIHSLADVISATYDEDRILIKYRANDASSNKIKRILHEKTNHGS